MNACVRALRALRVRVRVSYVLGIVCAISYGEMCVASCFRSITWLSVPTCVCSAITHEHFLRFLDDFGKDALDLVKAKLALVSTEVWLDGIYQRELSLRCLRIKTFTIKTLNGTPACVFGRVDYLCWVMLI